MASNFEFYSPTRVIFGKGTEQRVGALVREYGGTRVLIVYGGKSAVRSGVLDRAENSLVEAGLSSWTLGGVVPTPHLDKVYEGIRIGKENSIDFLLAVGGGSVIDTAKAIAYGLAEPEKDVWELYEHTRTASKCLPVASILTIAAAGSETSNSSVITRVDMGVTTDGTDEEVALKGIDARVDFYHSIGMPAGFHELGIDPTDAQIDEMARRCLEASGSALGSAKKLSLDDMIAIYHAANH